MTEFSLQPQAPLRGHEVMNDNNKSTFLEIFGDTISSRRKELKISQKDLSERCGIDRAYICHLESGRRNPSIELFNRVANGLRMKPSRLLALCERNYRNS